MTPDELQTCLLAGGVSPQNAFEILKCISTMIATGHEDAQNVLIRSLEHKKQFHKQVELLNALLREAGLYPYIEDPETLSTKDLLAYELHRPLGSVGEEVVFHLVQAQVYWDLLDGRNVVLSAPTSFGKSLITDAIVTAENKKRIVVVVPTIALIDETRRRLSKYNHTHKIITHSSQIAPDDGRGVIYVLTQERVIEREDLYDIDLLIIDEFYKLDPSSADEARSAILNHAFYKVLKTTKQFYLLGPNIHSIPQEFIDEYNVKFIPTDYCTVATNVLKVDVSIGPDVALINLVKELHEPTIIYCQSPPSAKRVVDLILNEDFLEPNPELNPVIEWISEAYHEEWVLCRALRMGIGIHHARIPRALAQLQVRLFNQSKLKFLVCTSTLIEGVNTAAKNVVIWDNKIANKKFDYFTFKNIQGRSGRMLKHFVGNVYLFHEPPKVDETDLDFPVFTQADSASDGLLMQLEEKDLNKSGLERVNSYKNQDYLSIDTIRANAHVDPSIQVALAKHLFENAKSLSETLSWKGEPTSVQLREACFLVFEWLLQDVNKDQVRTAKQLAYLTNFLRSTQSPSLFIRRLVLQKDIESPDAEIDIALDFLRNWAGFHLPRALITLERIQNEVFGRLGYPIGTYSVFAMQLEHLFLPAALFALDEYGLPLQIVDKLKPQLHFDVGLDKVIEQIKAMRRLQLRHFGLTSFECEVVSSVQETL